MAETVLVTGGNGFVAGWCIARLLQRGYAVRATLRSPSKEGAVRDAVAGAAGSLDALELVVADLNRDEGWDAAASSCDYVLHVASPLGAGSANDADALLGPAREGTLRVLRAAARARVKRVVMTSSTAAATPRAPGDRASDESVWTDPDDPNLTPYRRSKLLAERAAWDFAATRSAEPELTTILPTAIFGPVLSKANLGSVQVIGRLLEGRPPAIAHLGFCVVDVRDLADLHVRALTAPEAAGQRFIAAGDFLWMGEIAAVLRARLGARADRVPTRAMPDFLFRGLALAVPALRSLAPLLGRRQLFSAEKARRTLGFAPRPAEVTLVDCAESLLG